ncbi:hypothetical protein DNK59_23180 [Pseudomonas sp. TKO26]|nr:hypothetical protein DNK62_23180 [Pseudomonas sp. TKO30]PYY83006.1 hypothetical protein DNK61_22530 [Pseudomonas sp. TKO29]PYY85028.1 hypothetical protein DNK59_23180 [Pseudomonas sp. TKO26]PYY97820.1 hypothetical protein DNK60_24005 [Pseudomonas sp. TKO14]
MTAPPQGRHRTTTGRYGLTWRSASSIHAQLARRSQDPRVDATTLRRKAGPGQNRVIRKGRREASHKGTAIGMPLLAVRRDSGRKKAARYLAGTAPALKTGRLLSLEQVPTLGLQWLKTRAAYAAPYAE